MRKLLIKLVVVLVVVIVGVVVIKILISRLPSPQPDQEPSLMGSITNKAKSLSSDTTDWSTSTLQQALAEFNSYLPVIHDAGFAVSEVRVEAGLFPSVTATFTQIKAIPTEEQEKILQEHEHKKILSYMLKSLFRVYGMQLGQFRLVGTEMCLSLAPSTTLLLNPKTDEPKPGDGDPGNAKSTEDKPQK